MTSDLDMTGTARAHLRDPSPPGGDATGVEAVAALQSYADGTRHLARVADALHAGGWEVKVTRIIGFSVHAAFEGSYDEAVRSVTELLPPGETVDWFAYELALGGFVVGQDPAAFGPGSPLPLFVVNHLTGRQERVSEEEELRAAVVRAIAECADWWETHPDQAPDANAGEIAAAIGAKAEEVSAHDAPIPAHWSYRVATAPLGPSTLVALTTEAHLRWAGAKRVFETAAQHDPRKWAIEDQAIELSHYEGLAREVFAAGARDAVARLRA